METPQTANADAQYSDFSPFLTFFVGPKASLPFFEEAEKVLTLMHGEIRFLEFEGPDASQDVRAILAVALPASPVAIIVAESPTAPIAGLLNECCSLPVLSFPMAPPATADILAWHDNLRKAGSPGALFAVGIAGCRNAALFAAQIAALNRPLVANALNRFRTEQTERVLSDKLPETKSGS